jgi:hypothetical protein
MNILEDILEQIKDTGQYNPKSAQETSAIADYHFKAYGHKIKDLAAIAIIQLIRNHFLNTEISTEEQTQMVELLFAICGMSFSRGYITKEDEIKSVKNDK